MMNRLFVSVIGAFLLVVAPQAVFAKNELVELPRSFKDFAINPDSGVICCIDFRQDEAYFLNDKLDTKQRLKGPVQVGSGPACVTFKRYGEKSYFIVACIRDSRLDLIDSDSLELVKRISIKSPGVSWVANSLNPADPFVYYNCSNSRRSPIGAVNMRTMNDCGSVIESSQQCQLSADGKNVYVGSRAGNSDYSSFGMTSSFEDEIPKFSKSFQGRFNGNMAVPGPFGDLVAVGPTILKNDLRQTVAQSDNSPICFLKDKPFIVCATGLRQERPARLTSEEKYIRLSAVSANTFRKVGAKILIPKLPESKDASHRGRERLDFRPVANRHRVLLDEKRQRLMIAKSNVISVTALDKFEFPDEVLMRLPQNEFRSMVGQPMSISLAPTNSEVSIEIDDLPEGAKLDGDTLTWTSKAEQVGIEKIPVRLKYKNIECQRNIKCSVAFPSIMLDREFSALKVSPDSDEVVLWTASPFDHRFDSSPQKPTRDHWLALVNLKTGTVIKRKKIPFVISTADVDSHYVYVASAETNYCQILAKNDLSRIKTIYFDRPVLDMKTDGKTCRSSTKKFSLPELNEIPDKELDKIIKQMWDLEEFRGARSRIPLLTNWLKERNRYLEEELNAGKISVPSISASISHWEKSESKPVLDATHRSEIVKEFGINVFSAVSNAKVKTYKFASKVVDTKSTHSLGRPRARRNVIGVRGTNVVCLDGNELYQVDIEDISRSELPAKLRVSTPEPKFISDAGVSEIKLDVTGGKKPLQFTLLDGDPGIEIDDSGTIKFDNTELNQLALKSLEESFRTQQMRDSGAILRAIREYQVDVRKPLETLTEKNYTQLPLRSLVRYRIIDSESQTVEGAVTLIVGVDNQRVTDLESEIRAQEEKRRLAQRPQRAMDMPSNRRTPDGANTSKAVAALEAKIETLEARLDLMSRQLNQIIKLLEKKDK